MDITMLGTGHAVVTECYNTCFVLSENRQHFLVDGGGGSTLLHRLKYAKIDIKEIRTIFVTHKHIDHLLGIMWLIRLICQGMNKGIYDGEAVIYSHKEVIEILKDMAEKLLQKNETKFIDDRLHFVIVKDKDTKEILNHNVTFFDIHSTKDTQFGFCMDLGNDEKLTCCGDEPYRDCEYEYVKNSTWLLHEAFCLFSEAHIFSPYEKHHSTVKDACELAQKLNVKNLLLYHTEDKNIAQRKQKYSDEGKNYYNGNLYIPDDLEVLHLC